MHKLQLFNAPPVLLSVKLRTCNSSWKEIKAGVPQGTKLGPLYFLMMVNDLSSELHLYKYVDDCAVSEVVLTSM